MLIPIAKTILVSTSPILITSACVGMLVSIFTHGVKGMFIKEDEVVVVRKLGQKGF
jgi:hypothetical protein